MIANLVPAHWATRPGIAEIVNKMFWLVGVCIFVVNLVSPVTISFDGGKEWFRLDSDEVLNCGGGCVFYLFCFEVGDELYVYFTGDPGEVRILPLGFEQFGRPASSVAVWLMLSVNIVLMPSGERALLYEGAVVVGRGEGAEAVVVMLVVELTEWRRARVEIMRGMMVGVLRVEVSVCALVSA